MSLDAFESGILSFEVLVNKTLDVRARARRDLFSGRFGFL